MVMEHIKLKVKLTRAGDALLWDVLGEPETMKYNSIERTFEPTFTEFMNIFGTHIWNKALYFHKIEVLPYEIIPEEIEITAKTVQFNEAELVRTFRAYTDHITAKRLPTRTEFYLHFKPDSPYFMQCEIDAVGFCGKAVRDIIGAVDEMSTHSKSADIATYSVYYSKKDVITVIRWTKDQRAEIEALDDLENISKEA